MSNDDELTWADHQRAIEQAMRAPSKADGPPAADRPADSSTKTGEAA